MKRLALFAMIALMPTALAAQQAYKPIIPNTIAPDHQGAQVSVTVTRGLTSNRALRGSLRRARIAMQKGEEVSPEMLSALGRAGDGLAAQRYVRHLLKTETNPDPSDLAYYAAIAVGTGRVWTLGTMVEAMHKLDPNTEPRERVRKYIQVLYPHAWEGNTLALQAVIDFNGEDRLFGPLSEQTRQRIQTVAAKHGDGRIELGMAIAILERNRARDTENPGELAQARSLLDRAAVSTHLAVATSAQNLLRLMDVAPTTDQQEQQQQGS